jgi:hypothetical protein
MSEQDHVLREQLKALLEGRNAHLPFENITEGFTPAFYNSKFSSIPYSPWELLEHIRIAQSDILEFIRNPQHVSPKWPEGYWPPKGKDAGKEDWDRTVQGISNDLKILESMVEDPSTDFFSPIPHARDYTIFREILLVADHNAYHLGQFVVLKRLLKITG